MEVTNLFSTCLVDFLVFSLVRLEFYVAQIYTNLDSSESEIYLKYYLNYNIVWGIYVHIFLLVK